MAIWIDSDLALGSRSGDVDDAFAITAVARAGAEIAGLSAVFGNTDAISARRNLERLSRALGIDASVAAGAAGAGERPTEASRALLAAAPGLRILAIGPLTNIAAALTADPGFAACVRELILLGANTRSHGRWPPLWPFEFNLTKDRAATCAVLSSAIPVTIVPLDVARRLSLRWRDIDALDGAVGALLREGARRWWRRGLLLKGARSLPVWDLVAAMYAVDASLFETAETTVLAHSNAWLEFGRGTRPVRVVRRFDPAAVWSGFRARVSG